MTCVHTCRVYGIKHYSVTELTCLNTNSSSYNHALTAQLCMCMCACVHVSVCASACERVCMRVLGHSQVVRALAWYGIKRIQIWWPVLRLYSHCSTVTDSGFPLYMYNMSTLNHYKCMDKMQTALHLHRSSYVVSICSPRYTQWHYYWLLQLRKFPLKQVFMHNVQ